MYEGQNVIIKEESYQKKCGNSFNLIYPLKVKHNTTKHDKCLIWLIEIDIVFKQVYLIKDYKNIWYLDAWKKLLGEMQQSNLNKCVL